MRKAEYGCAREFTENILKQAHKVFSVDKLVSNDKTEATLIVRFNDNTVKSGTFTNNYSVKKKLYFTQEGMFRSY